MSYKAVLAVLAVALLAVAGAIIYINMDEQDKPVEPDPPAETYYSISYVLNGGTADPESPLKYKAGEVTRLGTPTKSIDGEDIEFLGWYEDSAFTKEIKYISSGRTGNITVYAKWDDPEIQLYSVKYVLNGGTADPESPEAYVYGTVTQLGTPTKTISGIVIEFLGWYEDSAFTKEIKYISAERTGDITVYAKWNDPEMKFSDISYVLNGGTAVADLPMKYVEGGTTSLGKLVKVTNNVSYRFLGWSFDPELTDPVMTLGKDVTGNITLYASWAEPEAKSTYKITYVLNGGTADSSSPSTYSAGKATDLGCPTMQASDEGYYFMGWYLDAACTRSILYVPSDMIGDITVFASWDTDVVGHGFQFDTVSVTTQTWFGQEYSTTTYGTFAYTYLHYSEDDGYLQKRVTGTKSADGSYVYRETVDWQSSDGQSEVTDVEEGVVIHIGEWNVKTTKVTVSTDGGKYIEEQYLIYGWLPAKMESSYRSGAISKTSEYTLTDLLKYEAQSAYTIKAYSDKGLTVTGAGTIQAYSRNVKLTVSGDGSSEFAGWYDEDGNLLSKENTYTIDLILSDVTVFAMNSNDMDYVASVGNQFTMSTEVPLKDTEWILQDDSGKTIVKSGSDSFSYTFVECGAYLIMYSGTDSSGNILSKVGSLIVDGTSTVTYEWSYNGNDYTATLDILYSDYYAYHSNPIVRSQTSSSQHDLEFVTYKDKYVVSVANQIASQTSSLSKEGKISVLLRFVQAIPYVTDSESAGTAEYFKFPLETLYDYGGDCEDTTFLFCAIGKAMGFDVAIMYFEGHAAGGVNMKEVGYGSDNIGIEKVRGYFGSYSYYVLKSNNVVFTYLYPEDVGLRETPSEFYLFCETTTDSDKYGNMFDIGDVPLYKSYGVSDNPYSSLNVEKVIPVV